MLLTTHNRSLYAGRLAILKLSSLALLPKVVAREGISCKSLAWLIAVNGIARLPQFLPLPYGQHINRYSHHLRRATSTGSIATETPARTHYIQFTAVAIDASGFLPRLGFPLLHDLWPPSTDCDGDGDGNAVVAASVPANDVKSVGLIEVNYEVRELLLLCGMSLICL
ncbi:hypothetical protein V7S43_006063 [Phytophthora oleae]|uniref:Uncharacterized protein n=1 Tax=Phytophthora oleae TaxID=2107226 RepID=A0ABD3FT13_9STRA